MIQNICISKLAHGNAADSEHTKFQLLKQIGVMKVLFIIRRASLKIRPYFASQSSSEAFISCVIQNTFGFSMLILG